MVHEAGAVAKEFRLGITSDGTVTSSGDVDKNQLHGMDDVAARLAMALRYANDLDHQTSTAIAALLPAVAETMTAVDPATIPREGSDPRGVKRWWDSLSAAQQRWLIENDPDRIGRLDGVPAEARDLANRLVLDRIDRQLREQSANLHAQMDAMVAGGRYDPTAHEDLKKQIADVDGKLRGVETIERRLRAQARTGVATCCCSITRASATWCWPPATLTRLTTWPPMSPVPVPNWPG
jgi:hypothetical protein